MLISFAQGESRKAYNRVGENSNKKFMSKKHTFESLKNDKFKRLSNQSMMRLTGGGFTVTGTNCSWTGGTSDASCTDSKIDPQT